MHLLLQLFVFHHSHKLSEGILPPAVIGKIASLEKPGVLSLTGKIIVKVTAYRLGNYAPLAVTWRCRRPRGAPLPLRNLP